MQKLTLSVDERIVVRAKRYARSRGTSVSKIVETLLSLVAESANAASDRHADGDGPGAAATPVLSRLRGSLPGGSPTDHHQHLRRKYL